MLILSRSVEESIMIDDAIEVVVLGVKGNQVKLGIRAPRDVDVHRKEVYQEIEEANRKAAVSSVDPATLSHALDSLRAQQKNSGSH